jgi:hypothetical protein
LHTLPIVSLIAHGWCCERPGKAAGSSQIRAGHP